ESEVPKQSVQRALVVLDELILARHRSLDCASHKGRDNESPEQCSGCSASAFLQSHLAGNRLLGRQYVRLRIEERVEHYEQLLNGTARFDTRDIFRVEGAE